MKNTKVERTVITLMPELLAVRTLEWVATHITITGGTIVEKRELTVGPYNMPLFGDLRKRFFYESALARLNGKKVVFLICLGPDIVWRASQIVGTQQDPNDWTPTSINGALRAELGITTIVSRDSDDVQYHYNFAQCPATRSQAKKLLRSFR